MPIMHFSYYMFVCLVPFVVAHSWAERAMVVDKNGYFIGEAGFPRGFGECSLISSIK